LSTNDVGLQLLKVILAPSIDFGLLNPLAVRGLDVRGRLAPTTVEVVRAKKGLITRAERQCLSRWDSIAELCLCGAKLTALQRQFDYIFSLEPNYYAT
jgi:hypothetical protein